MSKFVLRVQSDIKEVHRSYGHSSECPPIFAQPVDDRLDTVRALIVGPPDTPYAHGLFLFEIGFSSTYPIAPPRLKLLTTDSGRVRLNPNLYADGKVCLSILGTWHGESGEVWRPSYSLGYVLQCVQCLIMNGEPYFNEPGFEKERLSALASGKPLSFPGVNLQASGPVVEPEAPDPSGDEDKDAAPVPLRPKLPQRALTDTEADKARQLVLHCADAYTAKVGHEVLRVGVCDLLESLYGIPTAAHGGEPAVRDAMPAALDFAAEIKRQFLLRYALYTTAADRERTVVASVPQGDPCKVEDGQTFAQAPFEGGNNSCCGRFGFATLRQRLEAIKAAADTETQRWVEEGKAATARSSYAAGILADEAAQLSEAVEGVSGGPVSPDNVFHWQMTFMPLDGTYGESAYTADVVFPQDEEPPRVRFVQPLYHPNVSEDGAPCFFHDEAAQGQAAHTPRYVATRLMALLSCTPRNSSSAVLNPTAAAQCFAADDAERRAFKKKARQLARRTTE